MSYVLFTFGLFQNYTFVTFIKIIISVSYVLGDHHKDYMGHCVSPSMLSIFREKFKSHIRTRDELNLYVYMAS